MDTPLLIDAADEFIHMRNEVLVLPFELQCTARNQLKYIRTTTYSK